MSFNGFSPKSITFLKELAVNNNKQWFEKNRIVYEETLLSPLKQLTTALGNTIIHIDDNIDTTPQVNRTISRIYRDIRFSDDKSPYRTNAWISFKRSVKIWGNVPEFYFYFTPETYQYGMGFYSALPKNMKLIRDRMEDFPDEFKKITDWYKSQKSLVLGGEEYKKIISSNLPEDFRPWFQKRNMYLSYEKKIDDAFYNKILKDKITQAFESCADLYHFFIDSIF